MNEKLQVNTMRECILEVWKSKLSYPFNYKDLEEFEKIIDYYEEKNQELKKRLKQAEEVIEKIENYIYINSIPINLLPDSPINKADFEGDINEVLDILNEYKKEV